jgi:hypothetical protein
MGFLPALISSRIVLARFRRRPEAEHAVFRVIDHLATLGHEAGDHLRDADTQVHVGAVDNVLRRAPGHLPAREADALARLQRSLTGNLPRWR